MSVIGSNILAGASGQGGYFLTNSLRFRSSASAYLNRTPASAGNRRTWTWSGWVKRSVLSSDANDPLFQANYSGTPWFILGFTNDNKLQVAQTAGVSPSWETTAVFRDPSAWYHIVLAVDTTSATSTMNGSSTDRFRLYVNGTQYVISGGSVPSQNADLQVNNTVSHTIGGYPSVEFMDGYLAEVNFIDGQALTPSSFGETSATTGVWIPKKYTGTYGTNGFYLKFTDTTSTSTLGTDFSGNSNTWTVNNISLTSGSTYDSMNDVPTLTSATVANYAVLNPLDTGGTAPSAGNLQLTAGAAERGVRSTFAIPTTGLYYAEALVGTNQSGATDIAFGFVARTTNLTATPLGASNVWAIYSSATAQITRNGSTTNAGAGTALVSGDVLQLAIDLANNKGWVGKNNTWFNGTTGTDGNPSTGANPTFTFSSPPELFVLGHCYSSTIDVNFGQRPFSYTPPTGFVRLNTFNLPTPTIGATASTQANDYFDVSLYTGSGSTQTITNSSSMQPDFVWIKSRSGVYDHNIFDSVRGVYKQLVTNATYAENNYTTSLTAFNSNGFSLGSDIGTNNNGSTFVAWQWKANGAGSTNTQGSITSTVSANTTAGFSIVTWTNNNTANQSVGHGLGVTPSMIITKDRDNGTYNWATWFTGFNKDEYLLLNTTGAKASYNTLWYQTPTSSVFYIGSTGTGVNAGTDKMVAYCFAPVAGYSAMGSYTGNGSSDGVFVFTGFRPRFVMYKRTDSTGGWIMYDTARDTSNVVDLIIEAQSSGAEGTGSPFADIDFVSNGFKTRGTSSAINASGGTYIYMAFCESPFKFSNAR
jgi:hypothetical protein